jgi:preprotein translocase subunit SecG
MIIYVLAFLHTIFCVSLVALILLHSGKGGGLSASLGGGMGSTFSGTTIMEKNLTRLTLIVVALFATSTVALIFLG